jgi:hypothetical protein
MMIIWILLIGCWLAVAAERYIKRARRINAKEQAFIAESAQEAYAIKAQREALQRAALQQPQATVEPNGMGVNTPGEAPTTAGSGG